MKQNFITTENEFDQMVNMLENSEIEFEILGEKNIEINGLGVMFRFDSKGVLMGAEIVG